MQTIFCVYETEERFPRFVRSAPDADAAFQDILANALDCHEDDLSAWVASRIADEKRIARYDLQVDVADTDVQFFLGYWEGQFADLVSAGAAEDDSMDEDELASARRVLEAIEQREGQT
ncbi:hypothetical protein K3725_20300 (plasmid) [Leisingera sp. S132]|uniref:hypothetical protein n=1 Tax=Leisingera sp. S132 TaxID=2867016 RepID=UPI0021A58018|nr:hypothetical protein [Leisingera sp. S132]UWQ81456.1 hypothetical protein K3725_20300 [Leisingera sp. S132]